MSAELNTTYLGLKLQNPLVISACPLCAEIDQLRRLEEAGAAAAVLPSLFEEQIEHEAEELGKVYEFHTDSFAESLTYFPEQEDYRTGPDAVSGNHRRGEEGGADAGHRQPQRQQPRRLDPLRQDDAGRRGRRPGAERLLRRRRPRHDRPGRGIPLPRTGGRREGVDLDPAGREARAVLQRDGQHGRPAWPRPGPTAWCSSTASSSRTSTWRRWRPGRNST